MVHHLAYSIAESAKEDDGVQNPGYLDTKEDAIPNGSQPNGHAIYNDPISDEGTEDVNHYTYDPTVPAKGGDSQEGCYDNVNNYVNNDNVKNSCSVDSTPDYRYPSCSTSTKEVVVELEEPRAANHILY